MSAVILVGGVSSPPNGRVYVCVYFIYIKHIEILYKILRDCIYVYIHPYLNDLLNGTIEVR